MDTVRIYPATGPDLAEALGGTFDFNNGKIWLMHPDGTDYFVRCSVTGKVWLDWTETDRYHLGMMSDGVGALAAEFVIAVERLRAGISPS